LRVPYGKGLLQDSGCRQKGVQGGDEEKAL
jgi:hypothetical protein